MKYLVLVLFFLSYFSSCKEDKLSTKASNVEVKTSEPALSEYERGEINKEKVSIVEDEVFDLGSGPANMKEFVPPSTPIPEHLRLKNEQIVRQGEGKLVAASTNGIKDRTNKENKVTVKSNHRVVKDVIIKRKKRSQKKIIPQKKVVKNVAKKAAPPLRKVYKKPKGKLFFPEKTYNFGVLVEGDEITHTFEFTNTGRGPIAIENVSVTCGCTTPNFPFLDIAPGESNKITVHYSTKNKWAHQNPSLTIFTNGEPPNYVLYLEGDVHERPREVNEIITNDTLK